MSMTHVGAPLRQGDAVGAAFDSGQLGAATSPVYVYNVVPLTLQAANIAASQTPGSATNMTLTAGTGTTSVTFGNQTCVKLDIPRNIRVVSAGNDSGITFTVSGFDQYGQAMTETITGANAGTASGKKAFLYVYQIATSGAAAGAVTVGTGDVLGLPYQILSKNYITPKWNNATALDAGTTVVADTNTATATTGDVRGTYTPSSATDGSKRLSVFMFLNDVDDLQGATSLYGVAQA